MGDNSVTLQLRYLQTLREIGGSQNSTIVFPLPIDIVRPMMNALGNRATSAEAEQLVDEARAEADEIESGGHRELEAGERPPEASTNGKQDDEARFAPAAHEPAEPSEAPAGAEPTE
jgi:hypothetical protein